MVGQPELSGRTGRMDKLYREKGIGPAANLCAPAGSRHVSESRRATAVGCLERARVLIVDDDDLWRQSVAAPLESADIGVIAVRCCHEALATVWFGGVDIDLAIVADGFGVDFATGLPGRRSGLPFILTTESLPAENHDSVRELGSVAVLEKPIDIGFVLSITRACAQTRRYRGSNDSSPDRTASSTRATTSRKVPRPLRSTGSTAERFANLMLQAMESDSDPKTVTRWARLAGVSNSSLAETCRLLRVHPHDARDLVRMLRAIVSAKIHDCQFDVFLDVSDRRTLNKLIDRSGLNGDRGGREVTIEAFFESQRFIANDNEGLRVFWSMLTRVIHDAFETAGSLP